MLNAEKYMSSAQVQYQLGGNNADSPELSLHVLYESPAPSHRAPIHFWSVGLYP